MIPYYILCFLPLFLGMLEKRGLVLKTSITGTKRPERIGISAFFLIFIILLSLRSSDCGVDVKNYLYYFNRYTRMSFKELLNANWTYDVEIGYRVLNYVFKYLGTNFQFFLFGVAVLSVWPIGLIYKKETRNTIFAIALFLGLSPYSLYFSGLRQVLAMAFVVPAYYFTKNKKIIPFVITVIVASTFHLSALVVLMLYPIYRAKITKKWLYFVAPLMILIYVFNEYIFSNLLFFLRETQYEKYTISSTGAYGMIVLLVMISVYIIFVTSEEEIELTSDEIGFRNILLLSTCLQFFAPLSTMAMRMNYYYLIIVPIAIDRLTAKASYRYRQVVKVGSLVLIIFFVANFIRNMYSGADILQIFPYIPFWDNR